MIKLTQKAIFGFIAIAFMGTTLSSCLGTSPLDFTKESETSQLKEIIEKHLPEGSTVYKIEANARANTAEFVLRGVSIIYEAEKNNFKSLFIPLGEGRVQTLKSQNPFVNLHLNDDSIPKGRMLDGFDYTTITRNVNKGIKLLDGEKIPTQGIESYTILLYGEKKYDRHVFELLSSNAAAGKYSFKFDIYRFLGDNDGNELRALEAGMMK